MILKRFNPLIALFGGLRAADDLPATQVSRDSGDCHATAPPAAENFEAIHQFRSDGGDRRPVGRGFLLPAG